MKIDGNLNFVKLFNFIRHLPNFLKLVYRLYKDPRVGFSAKFYVWSGVGYFVLPFDLFPDFLVPIVGYGEDIVVVFFLLWAFVRSCPNEVVWEHVRKIEEEDSSSEGFFG